MSFIQVSPNRWINTDAIIEISTRHEIGRDHNGHIIKPYRQSLLVNIELTNSRIHLTPEEKIKLLQELNLNPTKMTDHEIAMKEAHEREQWRLQQASDSRDVIPTL